LTPWHDIFNGFQARDTSHSGPGQVHQQRSGQVRGNHGRGAGSAADVTCRRRYADLGQVPGDAAGVQPVQGAVVQQAAAPVALRRRRRGSDVPKSSGWLPAPESPGY
jgi:hypothetical protein